MPHIHHISILRHQWLPAPNICKGNPNPNRSGWKCSLIFTFFSHFNENSLKICTTIRWKCDCCPLAHETTIQLLCPPNSHSIFPWSIRFCCLFLTKPFWDCHFWTLSSWFLCPQQTTCFGWFIYFLLTDTNERVWGHIWATLQPAHQTLLITCVQQFRGWLKHLKHFQK